MNHEIHHHGAVQGVTGSCHELVIDSGCSVLIDCGLFQGEEFSAHGVSHHRQEIDFDIRRIKALLITHCHIDHVGRIPYLLAAGFHGPIFCSEPTAVLLPLIQEDALHVGFTRDKRLVERFLSLMERRIIPVPYKQWTAIPLGLTECFTQLQIRFQPAGHILGSAFIECRIEKRRSGPRRQTTSTLFSGDLGGPYTPLLPAPRPPYGTDTLVIESTYGDRLHEGRSSRRHRLKTIIEHCLSNRGVALVPTFSIGRTQELLYELEGIIHRYGSENVAPALTWKDLEIIVDSPLAARFSTAYRRLRPYWDKEAKHYVSRGRHPLSFEQVTTIDSHSDHERAVEYLARTARPTVVLAASGMCAGGRIVNYLKALIGDSRTDIVFVGYQANGTPGRIIQKYGPRGGYVELDGTRYAIRAGIHTIGGYSAHADQAALISFVRRMRKKPGEIRIVHGDAQAKITLKEKLHHICPGASIIIPKN